MGRSFVVAAYAKVRLWPAHQLAGVARSRSLFVATPLSGFRGLPQTGFRKAQLASACLRKAASAKAGPFLSNLEQILFSKAFSAKDKEPSLRNFLLTQLGPFLHFSHSLRRRKKGGRKKAPLGFFAAPYFLAGNRRFMVFSEGGWVMKLTPK